MRQRVRVDWFRLLADLLYLAMPVNEVSRRLGIPEPTIRGWRQGAEPRHTDGEALIALWCEMTGKTRAGLPTQSAGFRD